MDLRGESKRGDRIDQEKDLFDETDDALNSSFSNLFALETAARGFDPSRTPSLSDEHTVQETLKADYNAILAGDLTDDDYLQPSPTDEHDVKEFTKFEDDTGFNLTRNDLIGTHIIELVEDKRARYERYLAIARVLSYVFYAIGWGLGLAGHMLGFEGPRRRIIPGNELSGGNRIRPPDPLSSTAVFKMYVSLSLLFVVNQLGCCRRRSVGLRAPQSAFVVLRFVLRGKQSSNPNSCPAKVIAP